MALDNKSNEQLVLLVTQFNSEKKPIWKKVAKELAKPRRSRTEVNLRKLDVYGNEKVTVLVPGKVLGAGRVSKKLTIAAFSFSENAKKLIKEAGGKTLSLDELYKNNPTGKDVLIIK